MTCALFSLQCETREQNAVTWLQLCQWPRETNECLVSEKGTKQHLFFFMAETVVSPCRERKQACPSCCLENRRQNEQNNDSGKGGSKI